MTAKSTRILKEVRPLAWPWCAVALAGVLPLFPSLRSAEWITAAGFYLGIPILATLAFGNEFRDRTFALVLSQPIERGEIWREKLMVTVFAVVTAALVFSLTLGAQINHQYPQFFLFIAASTLAIVASAAFWTLWTRSTMGGVALNLAVLGMILIWADVQTHLIDSPYSVEENSAAVLRVAMFLACYGGLMLWLGWRKLQRFQATGAMAGDDLMTAGPEVMPRALAGLFRSRSHGAVLNLVRKEFHLLRPVWILSILTAVGWSALTTFEVMHEHLKVKVMPTTAGAVGAGGVLLMALLAGTLSLGEERTTGRHAWHLTLPVSARVQWLVKFLMALVAGTVCAGVMPLLLLDAGKNWLHMSFLADQPDYPAYWLRHAVLLTALAFWCACAADGTITAILWTMPALVAIGFIPVLGYWLAENFMRLLALKTSAFANFRLDVFMFHTTSYWAPQFKSLPLLVMRPVMQLFNSVMWRESWQVVWFPVCIVAIVQSYRMFKKHAVAGGRMVIRRLGALLGFALACAFTASAIGQFGYLAQNRAWSDVFLTDQAIEKLLFDEGSPNSDKTVELTAQDLDKIYPLPKETLAWLNNARITLTPKGPSGRSTWLWKLNKKIPATYYDATVHLEDGTDVAMSLGSGKREHEAYSLVVRIRWPGAATDEPLGIW